MHNEDILKGLSLLFVEDELLLRKAMGDFLAPRFERLHFASNGREALELFARDKPDLVLTDIIMPIMDGIALTEELRRRSPETPVVLYSAFSEVPYLLRGIELGVAGFISKPCDDEKLIETLTRAALPVAQRRQLSGLKSELRRSISLQLGNSPRMKSIAEQVTRLARSHYALLIQGETGTGKSRLASIIHNIGPAPDKPFVTVHLGSIPESLVAAELFGHERGSFTGAERKREGLVHRANGGTLFFDDIDAASHAVQGMLLQLVEERSYSPIGSNRLLAANLRIIAASNIDLADAAASGRFRQDLYYRLAGLVIDLPPLRTIPEDICSLAESFLQDACQELQLHDLTLADNACRLLLAHPWTGNIRELRNVVRRAALSTDATITADQLRPILSGGTAPVSGSAPSTDLPLSMAAVEQWALQRALDAAKGKKMVAARLLEMNYYTFRRRLERYGMDSEDET